MSYQKAHRYSPLKIALLLFALLSFSTPLSAATHDPSPSSAGRIQEPLEQKTTPKPPLWKMQFTRYSLLNLLAIAGFSWVVYNNWKGSNQATETTSDGKAPHKEALQQQTFGVKSWQFYIGLAGNLYALYNLVTFFIQNHSTTFGFSSLMNAFSLPSNLIIFYGILRGRLSLTGLVSICIHIFFQLPILLSKLITFLSS